jgi:hypothetical protein
MPQTLTEKQTEARQNSVKKMAPFQFPKGVSGNPGGRRKSAKVTEQEITALATIPCPDEWLIEGLEQLRGRGLTMAQAIAARAYYKGIAKGSMQAIAEILQRESGKMPNVQVTKKDQPDDGFSDMTPEEQRAERIRLLTRLQHLLEPPAETQDAKIVSEPTQEASSGTSDLHQG